MDKKTATLPAPDFPEPAADNHFIFGHSNQLDKIAKALLEFQTKVEPVGTDKSNPMFQNSYASVCQILESTKKARISSKLSIVQTGGLMNLNGVIKECFYTLVLHESGQWIRGGFLLEPDNSGKKNLYHAKGSALSYLSRFCYTIMLGVPISNSPFEDDGNSTSTATSNIISDSDGQVGLSPSYQSNTSNSSSSESPSKFSGSNSKELTDRQKETKSRCFGFGEAYDLTENEVMELSETLSNTRGKPVTDLAWISKANEEKLNILIQERASAKKATKNVSPEKPEKPEKAEPVSATKLDDDDIPF